MLTAIDTSALIALFRAESTAERVAALLFQQRRLGGLYVCAQVFAELLVRYDVEPLNNQLSELGIDVRLDTHPAVLVTAAERWRHYLVRRSQGTEHYPCRSCGHLNSFNCVQCQEILAGPKLILTDFIIGADALHRADTLITLDRGIYRFYYPELSILPNKHEFP